MKAIKYTVLGLVIGLVIGIGLGINIGKQRPLLSNPFAEDPVTQKAKAAADKAKEIYEQTKRIMKE